MPINLNLKQLNISDSDQIKLDKVNYNFDQLVANEGGPPGPQGPPGQIGVQGTSGQQGTKGPTGDMGYQGLAGSISDNYWKKIDPDDIDADTLQPIHFPTTNQFAPVVNIGYIETDSQYGTKLPLVVGKTPYQWNIYRRQYSISNLRFLNNDLSGNGFDFKLEKLDGKDQLTLGFLNLQDSKSTYKAARIIFLGSSTATSSFLIDDTAATFKRDTRFNSATTIKRNLFIENADAATDKIAISEDTTGLVKFKRVQDLGGTVPFGTIVSILPEIFLDNDNFINTETVFTTNNVIGISAGKGVGSYEGWYLCNGKTWTSGSTNYPLPMLGKFNYSIEDDPFTTIPTSQGSVNTSNSEIHITGGADIDMTANPASTLVYNVTSTVSTSTINALSQGSGATFKIKQLPQIIYLGRNDLYWKDPGTGQAPPINLTWRLDDSNPIAGERLNPDPYPLGSVIDQPENASYSTVPYAVEAPAGYFWSTAPTPADITNVPAWASISGITIDSGEFPRKIYITINVSDHPGADTLWTLGIDTENFISAASINITLVRDTTTPLFNTNFTCSNPASDPITYNFATGYSFQIVYQANSGWQFQPGTTTGNQPIFGGNFGVGGSIFYGLSTPFAFAPPTGGGTITVLNYALSNGNTTLTMNLSLTGIPTVGYLTTIGYQIANRALVRPTPVINTLGTAAAFIASGGVLNQSSIGTLPGQATVGAYVNYRIYVRNDTLAQVFIWFGIQQNTGGTNSAVKVFLDQAAYQSTATADAIPAVSGTIYWSNSSYSIFSATTESYSLTRLATTDSNHTIRLYWSAASTSPPNQRFPITIIV